MILPALIYSSPDKVLFSHTEAARYIGVHPNTLTKIVKDKQIKAYRRGPYKVYKIKELDSYINALPEYDEMGKGRLERRADECKKMVG